MVKWIMDVWDEMKDAFAAVLVLASGAGMVFGIGLMWWKGAGC